jgi:uncharacterized membrane protein YeaQ/YmgE (transglycosylase-associated protein family)
MTLDPAVTFVIVLLIGLVVGVIFDRVAGASWLTRQITGSMRTVVTSVLIGIAGAFIGFHIGGLLALSAIVQLVLAAIGAAAVLWGWRMMR